MICSHLHQLRLFALTTHAALTFPFSKSFKARTHHSPFAGTSKATLGSHEWFT